jgi:hypothetical protein
MPQTTGSEMERRRQEAIDTLTTAFADNVLSMEEYERRASLASNASLPEVLASLTADLKVPETNRTPNHLTETPAQTTGCVMGDRTLSGNWLTSSKVSSFTVMGSTKLDLRDSKLPPGPIAIEVFTLMGETKIIVPPHLPVRMNAFAFMAESTAHRSVNQQVNGAETWVEISGFVLMGSVVVKAMA